MKIDKIFKKYFDILTKIPPPKPVYSQPPPLFITIIIWFTIFYLFYDYFKKRERYQYMLMKDQYQLKRLKNLLK